MLFFAALYLLNHVFPRLLQIVIRSAVGPAIVIIIGIAIILSCIGIRLFHPKVNSFSNLFHWFFIKLSYFWSWIVKSIKKFYTRLRDGFYKTMHWQTAKALALLITVLIF